MAGESNDVTITTVSGCGGGQCTVVDVTGTLCLPPAYDSLLPLYDNKDLPNYHDAVHGTSHQPPPPPPPPPPSYDISPPTTPSTPSTAQPADDTHGSTDTLGLQPQQSN